ncbi:c3a7cd01-d9a6-402f-b8cb-ed1f682374ff [Sclerotinia trifoliorum]|uniref:C3a7cd01-d9a6-402f-b8cb-ed1f682374ff n=1 Tax=Sclerotinia trifoliorum TaxID=28548 RepID=A0A8H2W315_9HELO|nr:c3a7cd01-d9a6-402f-b8cb-ed1f682374ff [Sclerotinia trifoliorum]
MPDIIVKDLLLKHPPPASYVHPIPKATLSRKAWTDQFHLIPNPTIHKSTVDSVNQFLASDQYSPNSNSIYTADPSDHDRFDRMVHKLNYLDLERIEIEGDVTREFLCKYWSSCFSCLAEEFKLSTKITIRSSRSNNYK